MRSDSALAAVEGPQGKAEEKFRCLTKVIVFYPTQLVRAHLLIAC